MVNEVASASPYWLGAASVPALGDLPLQVVVGLAALAVALIVLVIFTVRVALGASPGELSWMVLRHSLAMILAGVGLGLAVSVAAGRLLQRWVAGMQPAEPSTFAITIAVMVVAALAASFVPARRASRINPMSALRQD